MDENEVALKDLHDRLKVLEKELDRLSKRMDDLSWQQKSDKAYEGLSEQVPPDPGRGQGGDWYRGGWYRSPKKGGK